MRGVACAKSELHPETNDEVEVKEEGCCAKVENVLVKDAGEPIGDAEGARFGLLGRSLGHSYSPDIHELLGSVPYRLVELPDEQAVRAYLARGGFRGLNVTIPYKRVAAACCDELSEAARRLGNVNTVVRRPDGTLYGDNTDYHGLARLVRSTGVDPRGMACVVLGDGGAAATACAVLADMGAGRVLTACRRGPLTFERLRADSEACARIGLVVNATPVGMYPACDGDPLVEPAWFPNLRGVVDLVYNPLRTRLVQRAREAGVPCAGGLLMLVAQARRSSDLFLGVERDEACEDEIFATLLDSLAMVGLIGMPGAGKTTLGAALAAAMGKEHVDVDAMIERELGEPVASFLAREGEEAFRQVESRVTAQACSRPGRVVSCGGGVVTRPENLAALRQNGPVVLLMRGLAGGAGEELDVSGRPLSQARGLARLREERAGLYHAWADLEVAPDEPVERTAARVRALMPTWCTLAARPQRAAGGVPVASAAGA